MRYDLNILWVEDAQSWLDTTKETLEDAVDELGVNCFIEHVSDIDSFFQVLEQEKDGFKKFDVFFIDFALSSDNIVGSDVIRKIKKENFCSDILFYSANGVVKLRDLIKENIEHYEGVYLSDRNMFIDKSFNLIEKNIRRSLSVQNIRGILMDETSENDFISTAYLLKKYETLSEEDKSVIYSFIRKRINEEYKNTINVMDSNLSKINENEDLKMKNILGFSSHLLPLKLKYEIFEEILNLTKNRIFEDHSLSDYRTEIINKRNKLAHQKLEMCNDQKHLLHFNNINQLIDYKTNVECSQHGSNSISIETWQEIRILTKEYAACFDELWEEIQ